MRTQHICPFCGAVMYESGGQLNPLGWIVTILACGATAAGVIAEISRTTDITRIVGIVGSVIFWGSIIYWIFKRKR